MNYETFTFEMCLLKKCREDLEDINNEIDDICYQYAGVRGVSYDKQTVTFSPETAMEQREKLYEALKEPQARLDRVTKTLAVLEPKVNSDLSKLPPYIQTAAKMKFWQNLTYAQIGSVYGYTNSGMKYRMVADVSKI